MKMSELGPVNRGDRLIATQTRGSIIAGRGYTVRSGSSGFLVDLKDVKSWQYGTMFKRDCSGRSNGKHMFRVEERITTGVVPVILFRCAHCDFECYWDPR